MASAMPEATKAGPPGPRTPSTSLLAREKLVEDATMTIDEDLQVRPEVPIS